MANIFGKSYTKNELMKHMGDISQVAGARPYTLSSGRSAGVRAVDVRTGGGLNFTVLPDRGMDIAWADYKSAPFSYISKTGVVAPSFFEPEGAGFLRSFYAGLLTTCGLTYMGAPNVDEGKPLGLHGRASNIPADDFGVYNEWENDEFVMKVRGKVRESAVFGENITLTREITARLGENKLNISDTVENCGYDSQPLMMLYHFNFGYPLVDEGTRLVVPESKVRPRDKEAEKGVDNCLEFSGPVHGYAEQVFYHDFTRLEGDRVTVKLVNKNFGGTGLAMSLTYDRSQLPWFVEWKQVGEGEYVVGLEPGTWCPEGRSEARKRGELIFIKPGEKRKFDLEIAISEL